MNTARLASESAETWNQKNQPSDIERFEETSAATKRILRELPSAALRAARRSPGMVLLVAGAMIGAIGLAWYLSNRE